MIHKIQANQHNTPAKVRSDEWSEHLVSIGKTRDQHAFKLIFDHFAPLIKGFCLNHTHQGFGSDAAEEVVQEVMLKIWQKAPMYDPSKAAASTWIYTVMRNARIDLMRKNKHRQENTQLEVDDLWDDDCPMGPIIQFQKSRNSEIVQRSLNEIPTEQREALIEVYLKGKSHSEVSTETGLPLGTVKSRVRMGLQKIQGFLTSKPTNAGSTDL